MSDQPSTIPMPPIDEHHHRDIQGGAARAAVFGMSDGLVSNVGLILGVAGADSSSSAVVLAGLAGLVAGAISMAAGEYNSMRVQSELLERELAMERREIERNPAVEAVELAQRYQSRGVDPDLARNLANSLIDDPDLALEFHAREELGIQPGELGSPIGAAVASLATFSVGAVLPLIPWLVSDGTSAIVATLVVALVAAVGLGLAIAKFTEVSRTKTVTRQVLFTAVPAALTYAIGSAVGVGV
ncbi:MAG: VIT1/CCC1 transporter family protein [Acidimicrobiales bacterium]